MAEWWESAPLAEEQGGGEWWAGAPLAEEADKPVQATSKPVGTSKVQATSNIYDRLDKTIIGRLTAHHDTGPVTEQDKQNVVFSKARGATALQGASFGFSDEIAGFAAGIMPGGQTGPEAKQLSRDLIEYDKTYSPKGALASELGGGVMTAGAGAMTAAGRVAATKAGAYGTAALSGGAYGAGTADDGIENRVKGGAMGAAYGLAFMGILQKVGVPMINAVWNKVRSGANDTLTKAEAQAWRMFKTAAKKDGVTDINAHMAKVVKEADNGQMAFETLGPNTKRLAVSIGGDDSAASTQMINALKARQERQKPFVTKKLQSIFKTDDFTNVRTELGNSFTKIGSPMYKKVNALPMEQTPEIGSLLTRPGMDKVLKKAAANASRKGEKLKPDTVGFYHNLKLAVDDMASNSGSLGNAKRETAASWKAISDGLVEQIEKQAPDYATARSFWRGKKMDEAALELGQKALSPSAYVEDIVDAISKMSESEKAFFKAGMFRRARVMLNNAPKQAGDSAGPFRNENVREKISAILGPDDSKAALKLFDDVSDQVANRRLIDPSLNSATAERLAAKEALKTRTGRAANAVIDTALRPKQALENLLSGGANKATKLPDKTKSALADLLTKNPELVKDVPKPVLAQLGKLDAKTGIPVGIGGNVVLEEFIQR